MINKFTLGRTNTGGKKAVTVTQITVTQYLLVLPQPQNMQINFTGYSKLPIDVNVSVNGYSAVSVNN